MSRRGLLVATLVVALGVSAGAHTTDPTIHTVLDAVTPALPAGATVTVRTSVADELVVANTTATPLDVLDGYAQPFVRVTKAGVYANLASPDWYVTNSPLGAARVPATAHPGASPRWRLVSRDPVWAEFDHRMHGVPRPLTPALRQAKRTVRLADWAIPLRYGGTAVQVTGHVEYRPVLGAVRTTVTRNPDGVHVDALDGRVPALTLTYDGPGTLLVEGADGRPFARVGPTKAETNGASGTAAEDARLRGQPPPPEGWRAASANGRLTWLDERLTAARWSVPTSAGPIAGTTAFVPATKRTRSRTPWVVAALVTAGAAASIGARRRHSRAGGRVPASK